MKKLSKKISIVFLVFLFAGNTALMAQNSFKVAFKYFMFNNKIPYLTVHAFIKVDGKLQPVNGIAMNVYMDEESPKNLIGKVVTNNMGDAVAVIPKELKILWDASPKHKFIASSVATKEYNESNSEIEITKAKILLDTITEGETKNIVVKIFEFKDNSWVPVKDVEAKAGIRRHASVLPAGKEQSYTTDSTGVFTAEFKRDSLPGDDLGNIALVAKVEDNDLYGNLVVEKVVPWGVKVLKENDFDKRTLYSARFKSPYWLIGMAYLVIGVVWSVLIYLIFVIVKVMKIGFNTKE
jgi:hypothetical protein